MAHFGHSEQTLLSALAAREKRTGAPREEDTASRRLASFRRQRFLSTGSIEAPEAAPAPDAPKVLFRSETVPAPQHDPPRPVRSSKSMPEPPTTAAAHRASTAAVTPPSPARSPRRASTLTGAESLHDAMLKRVQEVVNRSNRRSRFRHEVVRVPENLAEVLSDKALLRKVLVGLLQDAGASKQRMFKLRRMTAAQLKLEFKAVVQAELRLVRSIERGASAAAAAEREAEETGPPPPAPGEEGVHDRSAGEDDLDVAIEAIPVVDEASPPVSPPPARPPRPKPSVPDVHMEATASFEDMVHRLSQSAIDTIDSRAAQAHSMIVAEAEAVAADEAAVKATEEAALSQTPSPKGALKRHPGKPGSGVRFAASPSPGKASPGKASPEVKAPPPGKAAASPLGKSTASPPGKAAASPQNKAPLSKAAARTRQLRAQQASGEAAPVPPPLDTDASAPRPRTVSPTATKRPSIPAVSSPPPQPAPSPPPGAASVDLVAGDVDANAASDAAWLRQFLQGEANASLGSQPAMKPNTAVVRVRPLSAVEAAARCRPVVHVTGVRGESVQVGDHSPVTVDACLDGRSQEDVFQVVGVPLLRDMWRGYSSAAAVYGPPGGGKSYTAFGGSVADGGLAADGGQGVGDGGPAEGLVPRLCRRLLQLVQAVLEDDAALKAGRRATSPARARPLPPLFVDMSVGGVYGDGLRDFGVGGAPLVDASDTMPDAGVVVGAAGLSRHRVANAGDAMHLLRDMHRARAVVDAELGLPPSTCHTFVVLRLARPEADGCCTVGTATVYDLAAAVRGTLDPNLQALHHVMQGAPAPRLPAALPTVMGESWGGCTRTAVVVAIPPCHTDADASAAALQFGAAARGIVSHRVHHRVAVADQIAALQADIHNLDTAATAANSAAAAGAPLQNTANLEGDIALRRHVLEGLTASPESAGEATRRMAAGRASAWHRLGYSVAHEAMAPVTPLPLAAAMTSGGRLRGPHLTNLTLDTLTCGTLWAPLPAGVTHVGCGPKDTRAAANLVTSGVTTHLHTCRLHVDTTAGRHAVVVTLRPGRGATVYVNGLQVTGDTQLAHGDRVAFGTAHFLLFRHVRRKAAGRDASPTRVGAAWPTVAAARAALREVLFGEGGTEHAGAGVVEEQAIVGKWLAVQAGALCEALHADGATFDVQATVAGDGLKGVVATGVAPAAALRVRMRASFAGSTTTSSVCGFGRVVAALGALYHAVERPPVGVDMPAGPRRRASRADVMACLVGGPPPVAAPPARVVPAVTPTDALWDPEDEDDGSRRVGDAAKVAVLAQENSRLLRLLQAESHARAEAEAKAKHAAATAFGAGHRPGPYDAPLPPYARGLAGAADAGVADADGVVAEASDFAELLFNDLQVISDAYVSTFAAAKAQE